MASIDRASSVRRAVLIVSSALFAVGAFWIARSFLVDGRLRFGNPVTTRASEQAAFTAEPRQVRAEITHVRGNAVVRPGDKCEFLVERRARERESSYCNAQVMCGGRLLYGGPDRGFFACKFFEGERPDIAGSDPSTTGADQDAALSLNTLEGVMRVWDDAQGPLGEFEVEAEVLSVH